MSLYDKIKKRQRPSSGHTEAAARLLQAKTGKTTTPGSAPISAEAERGVAQQTQAQLGEVGRAGQMQDVGIEIERDALKQKELVAGAEIAVGEEKLALRKQQVMKDIRQKLDHAAQQLGLNRNELALNTRLFERRLESDTYKRDLKQQGTKDRLYDDAQFQRQFTKTIRGNQTDQLLQNIRYQHIINDEKRSWDERIGTLDADYVLKVAEAKIAAENKRAMWEGGTSAISEGFDYYSKKPAKTNTEVEA